MSGVLVDCGRQSKNFVSGTHRRCPVLRGASGLRGCWNDFAVFFLLMLVASSGSSTTCRRLFQLSASLSISIRNSPISSGCVHTRVSRFRQELDKSQVAGVQAVDVCRCGLFLCTHTFLSVSSCHLAAIWAEIAPAVSQRGLCVLLCAGTHIEHVPSCHTFRFACS